jgi:hypothetical protein
VREGACMSEEKKETLIGKLIYHVKVLVVAIIIVMLASFFLGKHLNCESFNRFVTQNFWEGGINCPVE